MDYPQKAIKFPYSYSGFCIKNAHDRDNASFNFLKSNRQSFPPAIQEHDSLYRQSSVKLSSGTEKFISGVKHLIKAQTRGLSSCYVRWVLRKSQGSCDEFRHSINCVSDYTSLLLSKTYASAEPFE